MHSKRGKHANNLTRINDQVKLLIVMLWISHWTHKANIGESDRRPKTKSVVLLAYLVFEFFGSCMNQANWSMSVRVLVKESKEVSFGLRMNSLFLQFVTLRWGWQCASFPFLHSLLQPTLSFALAGMILIDFQRERERLKFQRQSKLWLFNAITKVPSFTFKRENALVKFLSFARGWKVSRQLYNNV